MRLAGTRRLSDVRRPLDIRPRVLVVGSSWPPQTFLARLFDGLSRRFELHIAAREPLGDARLKRVWLTPEHWPRAARAAGVLLSGLPALGHPKGRRLLRAGGWRYLPLLRRRVDVIYFPWNFGATAHLPLLRLGLPAIVSCRGAQVQVAPHQPERAAEVAGLRESFELATRVHCVSEAILESAGVFGLDPAKARVIRPAVDPEVFAPRPQMTGPPWRLVAAGSLMWRKGFEDTLLAVRELVERGFDIHLDLAGDGEDRQRLLFAAHDLLIEDRVTFHGQVSPHRVRQLMHGAHAFVLSSLSEGIANVALEAMACGLPVVSTRCGGMEEAITDGVEGLLVPPQDPRALARALARLLGDGELRDRLGRAARRRIEADFRLDDQVQAFGDLIFEAMESNEMGSHYV